MHVLPDYTITVDGGQVHFSFNSYMYKKYCEKKGIELHELLRRVQKTLTTEAEMTDELKAVKGFTQDDLPDILLTAHQTYCLYNKLPFEAGELEAFQWIDAMGGLTVGNYGEVFLKFIAKLLNIDTSSLKIEEKKIEVSPDRGNSNLHGASSTY